jgi:hypothetical protein
VILLGYTHAAVIGMLQPEVAYPARTVKPSPTIITMIFREPCTCPDTHIELWTEPVTVDDQERLFY